jgi:hypothetical protein
VTQPGSPQELDGGVDEQDRDHTEEALAAAVAAMLAAHAAASPWLDLVDAELSGLIRQYLQRAALDMAAAAGLSPSEAAVLAGDAADGVMGDVARHTAAWLRQAAEDRAPAGGGAMGEDEAGQAAGIVARLLATYARERVREAVAVKLGATWKRWQTRMDSRVRPLHRNLQGDWKPIGKPFKTGGFAIMYPGDPEAPLDLTAGCRCHLIYLVAP